MSCRTCEKARQYLPGPVAGFLRNVELRQLARAARRAEKRAAKAARA